MPSTMKTCGDCERHVMGEESRCPFCGAGFASTPSPLARCGRAVVIGVSVVMGTVGCDPGVFGDDTGAPGGPTEGSSGAPTTTASASTGGTTTPSTGAVSSSGADSSSTLDGGVDDGDDQAGSFYAGPSPDTGASDYECDVLAQDCPRGEKCTPWANDGGGVWNATRCTPLAVEAAAVGEPCEVEGSPLSGVDDCGVGLLCFDVEPGTAEGTCEDLCTGTQAEPSCEDPDDVCVWNDGAYLLCLPSCNPVLQDCDGGHGCFPSGDDFACLPSSAPESVPGDPCGLVGACAPGQLCVSSDAHADCAGESCCTTVCSVDDPGADRACAAVDEEQRCVPWFSEPVAGYEGVGVCARPVD